MNAAHGGYADDFAAFLRQGFIGPTTALTVEPADPEIGSDISVQVAGLKAGRLVASNGQRWLVGQGSVVRLRVEGPLRLTLIDEAGHALAWADVDPWVLAPRLLLWDLPAQADYAQAELPLGLQTQDAEEVQVQWRQSDRADWIDLAPGAGLPLPQRPASLLLRAMLRSRHAAWSPQATVVVERSVEIVDPEPQWAIEPIPPVLRYAVAALPIRFRWATAAEVRVQGRVTAVDVDDPAAWSRVTVPVPTTECGPLRVEIWLTGVGGARRCVQYAVEVKPRAATCTTTVLSEKRLLIEVRGGRPLELFLPTRGLVLPLPAARSVIEHGVSLPTLADVRFEDDLGEIHIHALTLGDATEPWGPLSTMSTLLWTTR